MRIQIAVRRVAFTLVELLVVISIIGLLMSLTLPAINSAREAGRRTTCQNNVSNLTKAMRNFESTKRWFPGYRGNSSRRTANVDDANWVVSLFPFMGMELDYKNYESNLNDLGYKDVLVCPTNPPDRPTDRTLGYVVNAGRPDATSGVTDIREAGVCHNIKNPALKNAISNANTVQDNMDMTILVSENLNAADDYLSADEKLIGMVWIPGNYPTDSTNNPERRVNGRWSGWTLANATTPATNNNRARPSSFHPGGVLAGFVGGNVRFLRDDIDYAVYRSLMTSDGQNNSVKSITPAEVLLTESDFTR